MNSYSDFYDAPGRGSRLQDKVAIGDAIGSMVAATVFGLTRAVENLDPVAPAADSTPAGRRLAPRRWLRAAFAA